jgi:hypothetical protein
MIRIIATGAYGIGLWIAFASTHDRTFMWCAVAITVALIGEVVLALWPERGRR